MTLPSPFLFESRYSGLPYADFNPQEAAHTPPKDNSLPDSKSKQKADPDIFFLDSVFPEAESVFTVQPKTLEAVKDSALVVLDANTLLLPYLTGSQTLGEIKSTYKKLLNQKRLLIPARAAREFAKNRVKKISDVHQALIDKQSRQQFVEQDNYPLLEEFEEYRQLLNFGQAAKDALKKYRDAFGEMIKKVESWEWDDPISLLYARIIPERGDSPSSQEQPGDIGKAHSYRFTHRIPPGYMDKGKADEGIGDFVIWQTILDASKAHDKSVIFVTGEEKADWWHNSNKRQLYPRYELVDEFRRASGGHSFHIITFSRLLEMFEASPNVVQEVRVEELRQVSLWGGKQSLTQSRAHAASGAVALWFGRAGYSVEAIAPVSGLDFLVSNGAQGFAVCVTRL